MKKFLRFANFMSLGAGALGMALAAWLFSAGTDEKGLYPAGHIAWILLGILTAAVVIGAWLLTRQAGINRNYRQNFPRSLVAALGCAAGGIGLLSSGFKTLATGKVLGLLAGALGIFAAIPLFWAAVCRLRGQRCKLPVYILPCFFFALQLFVLGQKFGSEPEMQRYLYRFWATLSMVPACYWLWSFDVNLGKRPDCLFWCLVAGYCNLVAAVGNGQTLLHLTMAAWMLTTLPKLGYLPKPVKTGAEPATAEEASATPEAPIEVVPSEAQPVAEAPAAPAHHPTAPDLPDAKVILEELLREFGEQDKT